MTRAFTTFFKGYSNVLYNNVGISRAFDTDIDAMAKNKVLVFGNT